MKQNEEISIRILAVDDEPAILSVVKAALSGDGVEVLTATDPEAAWQMAREVDPHLAILDLAMPRLSGMALLSRLVDWNPLIDVVLLTGEYRTDYAVEAIQKGACDYLTKPVDIDLLQARIGKQIDEIRSRLRGIEIEEAMVGASRFGGMVGRSPELLRVFGLISRIAPHYRHALITGETGTGKELAARALHDMSSVSRGPFVVCNCAAIVETLFESELFGHVRGAFTGAVRDRAGLFESADGGTIFLDEIGELPATVQSKLLRVLQQHEIQRVGSSSVRQVDVRVIAATNRDLRAEIGRSQFREDLYYRLSMVKIHLPRLADRLDDLPLLERHFLMEFSRQYGKKIRGVTPRAQTLLARHPWTGNIREFENVIGHACMMTSGETIDVRDLPEDFQRGRGHAGDGGSSEPLMTLAAVELRHVKLVLERVGGNKQAAAEILGISRNTLYRILKDGGSLTDAPAG